MDLIAEGTELQELNEAEKLLNEFDKGEAHFYTDRSLSGEEISMIEQNIIETGVHLTGPVRQDARILVVEFQKRIAPLVLIGGAVATVIAVGAGLVGWQIFKTVKYGVPLWVWIVGGGLLTYLIFSSKPAKQAGGVAIQAGKVYVTRKAGGN